MAQKVDLHRLLVSIGTPLGIGQTGLIDAGIADQAIDGLDAAPLFQSFAEFSDGIEGVQFAVHGGESIEGPVVNLGHGIHLVNVADGTDDVIAIGGQEGCSSLPSKTRRASRDDHQFCYQSLAQGKRYDAKKGKKLEMMEESVTH